MAKQAVLQIAKEGEDLDLITSSDMALDSRLILPKIYAVKELVPDIPEGYISGTVEYVHGMGYAPMYLYYEMQNTLFNAEGGTAFDPERYIYGSQGKFPYMDGTRLFNDNGGAVNSYVVLFLDPLAYPATDPLPTLHGSPRLKIGTDLRNDADFRATVDSKYQTLKVHMQDQFVCNVPAHTAPAPYASGWVRDDWFELEHGLGYPPVHAPFVNSVGLALDLAYSGSIPSDFVVNDVNDMMAERWAYEFGWTTEFHEGVWIYVDVDNLYLLYRRQNWSGSSHNFPARTVRLNYTIFNLPINQEFNLLV